MATKLNIQKKCSVIDGICHKLRFRYKRAQIFVDILRTSKTYNFTIAAFPLNKQEYTSMINSAKSLLLDVIGCFWQSGVFLQMAIRPQEEEELHFFTDDLISFSQDMTVLTNIFF